MTIQDFIVAEARSWLGTPYHHLARVKGAGVDCAQILIAVYSTVGLIKEFDTGDYPMDWMMHRDEERYLGFITAYADQVESPMAGDVALYKVGRCFSHGAIVTTWPEIIHASRKDRAVVLADGTQGWLGDKDVTFWRIRGVS
jgi:cell wall-associated NlpC family hydrolase